MTSIYGQDGQNIACTVIEAGPCVVTQVKNEQTDGYNALQLSFGEKKEKNTSKPLVGHFKKANTTPKRDVVEFRDFGAEFNGYAELGKEVRIQDVFAEGDFLDAVGTSKGRIKVNLTGSRWTENTNIYSVCAMPPGAGKSPVFKTMTGCLVDLQTELMDMAAQTVREAEAKKELLDRKAKAAFDKAAKLDASDHDMLQAVDLKAQAEDIQIPPKPRLLAEDTTPEALVQLMAQHGGRMALLSSEGGIFDMMAGQYADQGKVANLAVYLQGWSGDAITQDRVGRAAIRIKEALLTVCVTTQPVVLARLGENPELAGRGLPVRFMFAVPPSNVGARDRYAVLRDVDPQVQKTYDHTIHELGLDLAKYTRAADLADYIYAYTLMRDDSQKETVFAVDRFLTRLITKQFEHLRLNKFYDARHATFIANVITVGLATSNIGYQWYSLERFNQHIMNSP
jgi:hypothetical protein